jgi:hypothetical protein
MGLSAACMIDNHLGMFACSYNGELCPGYVKNLSGTTNTDFKLYSVKVNDNVNTNPDYANWYKMVPYGAPYSDLNKNGMFDIGIDKPGIPDAAQTIFICLTDAFAYSRTSGEGFGGGIKNPLLNAEIHLTTWVYTLPQLYDVQFIKYEIINKGNKSWDKLRFGLFDDPDINFGQNNYIGCDTTKNLGYAYEVDSVVYGAYGINVLRGVINKINGDTMNFSSFIPQIKYYPCEGVPGNSNEAYHSMQGLKLDGSSFYDPTNDPPNPTKFVFSGDPETRTGWVPSKGYLSGCNGYDTSVILAPQDAKFILGLGDDNFSMAPGDTQRIYFSQMVALGNSNENSVTNLKSLADRVKIIFDAAIYDVVNNSFSTVAGLSLPGDFYLSQNFPNPFNITTKISYGIPRVSDVKLNVFDVTGRLVAELLNGEQQPGRFDLEWNATGFSSGIYFFRMEVVDKTSNLAKRYSNVKKMVLVK